MSDVFEKGVVLDSLNEFLDGLNNLSFIELPMPIERPVKKKITFSRECTLIETVDELDRVTTGHDLNKDIQVVARGIDPVTFQPRIIFTILNTNFWYAVNLEVAQGFKEKIQERNKEI